jgi:ATP-dependent Lhr-like helicase
VWGLSATLANLDGAAAALLGPARASDARIVRGLEAKTVVIDTIRPPTIERFPWAGHIGVKLLPELVRAIESARSTLVFCNVRSSAEIWYQAILEARPHWAGTIALHHGSLERDVRDWSRRAFAKAGSARSCARRASTSAWTSRRSTRSCRSAAQRRRAPAPARGTQRPPAGRDLARHGASDARARAGRGGRGARGRAGGVIEPREPMDAPIDVLVQHVVTCALGGGARPDELLAEVRTTHAYRKLSDAQWQWVLDFVVHGGASLNAYPEYRRVVIGEDGIARVPDAQIARASPDADRHDRVGCEHHGEDEQRPRARHVEESFIDRLRIGDCFVFAGVCSSSCACAR